MNEQIQKVLTKADSLPTGFSDIIHKDGVPLVIGGGSVIGFSLTDLANVSQQIGVILGMLVVLVTLMHRIYVFWKDTQK